MKNTRFPMLLPSGWIIVISLPSLLMIFSTASSFSAGILLSSLLIMSIFFMHSVLHGQRSHVAYSMQSILWLVGFLVFVMAHFYIQNLTEFNFNQVDISRFAVSYITLIFVLVCALSISAFLKVVNDDYFHQSCVVVSLLIAFNAFISLSKIDVFGTGLAKPTFIYLEPSHFALVAAPFISYYCLTTTKFKGMLVLFFVVFWAGYIQNFTMLLAALIAFILSTRRNLILSLSTLLLFASLLFMFIDEGSRSYFNDRLSFSSSSTNLSVLVLYQGWENAIKTLAQRSWLGGGFQQFGIVTLTGEAGIKIHQLLGFDINQFDGGSTAPKIIGEFGVFGLMMIIFYFISFIVSFRKIRSRSIESKKEIFASVVIITSVLEFFVRGVGYFSPSLFMLAVSVFYLLDKIRKESIPRGNNIS